MARVYNFNAGPAALPLAALERARDELIDFKGSGMSIIEHCHRGKEYEAVHDEAEALVRELLAVPTSTTCSSCKAGRASSLQWCR
jgi:phosphoserine aminotransferase